MCAPLASSLVFALYFEHRLTIGRNVIPQQYIWFTWASAFLAPWIALYAPFPLHRTTMLRASLATALFGLSEPLFVPEYWNPPSLFNLAQTTGFDIESFIFCFGIGGIGAVLYSVLTRQDTQPLPIEERRQPLHRKHFIALATPFIAFPILYFFPGIRSIPPSPPWPRAH